MIEEGNPGAAVTVVVPTYRRPELLVRCLAGLSRQSCPPAATIVVCRVGDESTAVCLMSLPSAPKIVSVERPGQLAAMAAGLAATSTPFVAFTDDDAVPRPDWLERLLVPFADNGVGGVGGRDAIGGNDSECPPSKQRVGIVSRWGRLIGNHHIGVGAAREVDVLKGVNCMYRRDAVAIPMNLCGSGAQVYNEVAIGLRAKTLGWRLIYDPRIVVDHYPGPRFDADARSGPATSAVFDAAYNLTLSIGSFDRNRAVRRAMFGVLVGDRALPGIARTILGVVAETDRRIFLARVGPALRGNALATLRLAKGWRVRFFEG
jgi:GT2 family glycosyltransferase